jgi:hypothetical protein
LQALTVFQVIVVVRAKDVGGDDCGEVAAILFLVQPVLHVNHALGICVALQASNRQQQGT